MSNPLSQRFAACFEKYNKLTAADCLYELKPEIVNALAAWESSVHDALFIAGWMKASEDQFMEMRKLLWLTHGCTNLYGDDGEMQCGRCMIDFKRATIQQLAEGLHERGKLLLDTDTRRQEPSNPAGAQNIIPCPNCNQYQEKLKLAIQIIEEAPHDMRYGFECSLDLGQCDCWKSKASSLKEGM